MSNIEWTEKTWNPVTGCTKVSAGCKHCYAETMAGRLKAMGANGYDNGFKVSLMHDRISMPIKTRKPTTFFVNSMSDLFHDLVDYDFVDRVMATISNSPLHTFQILTKRSIYMADYFALSYSFLDKEIPKNAWLGVSVENKKEGVPRIADLQGIPANVRFLSCEPLLEDLGEINLDGIHWVIVGGETGKSARPMKKEWVESIRDQCIKARVPFFFKQWGAYGEDGVKRSKKANGRMLDGEIYDGYPEVKA